MRTISQRELRNDSGEIMRALERGESFRVTRRGVPVGILTPATRDLLEDLTLRHGTGEMRFPQGVLHDTSTDEAIEELRGTR
ncbi:MAG: type II toxin-antitoxin system Phd/YefM family antitoxin [Microthrixaceae bacterium]